MACTTAATSERRDSSAGEARVTFRSIPSNLLVGTGRFELPTCRLGGGPNHFLNRAQRLAPVRSFFERPRCRLCFGFAGRDGQIRTADLSLRRRPLYPTELRPHRVDVLERLYQAVCSGSPRNLTAARKPRNAKNSRATSCVIANGGSDCVGASASSAGTFRKSWTINTKKFK
jgi:hypothetical protein